MQGKTPSARPGGHGGGRIGIVDIGSNSIRLVVYERAGRVPLPIFNEKVLCGLGKGLGASGKLNPEGMALALENLERFAVLAANMSLDRLDLLATAAVRDAGDGAKFVAEIEKRTGHKVRVVSGKEEAELSGWGVVCGMPEADGVMGDLGGGSLELMALEDGKPGPSDTLPLGPLRLTPEALGKKSARETIDKELAAVEWLRNYRGRVFYPVGGAWRSFARLHMSQNGYPLHIIHQYEISGREAREFAGMLAGQSARSLERIAGVSRRRLETLPTALLVLERLLTALQPKQVQFSAFGLREGFFFTRLPEAERQRDPLIAYAEDEAGRSRRFDLDPLEIHAWLDPLFEDERKRDRRLRRAACLLSDLGWAEHPDYRGEQVLLRILRMPVPGIDHRERALLALALMWRYKSGLRGPDANGARSLIDEESAVAARRIGTTLRLAYNLSGGAPGLLPRVPLRRGKNVIELLVPRKLTHQLGEVTERRLQAVAEAFGCKYEIVIEG